MRRTFALAGCALSALLAAAACGPLTGASPAVGPATPSGPAPVPAASAPASPTGSAPAGSAPAGSVGAPTTQRAPAGGGNQPSDNGIHRRQWTQETLTVQLCGVDGPVRFRDGSAQATSSRFGAVELSVNDTGPVVYGDLDGDGADEAAVTVVCDNGGGTGAGELEQGSVLVGAVGGRLISIGTVVPQTPRRDHQHVPLINGVRIAAHTVTVAEGVYRAEDPDCCPGAKASTVWSLTGGRLVPGKPVVT